MKIPNAAIVVIDREKVLDYLLNASHPDNGGKARFFELLGFQRNEWMQLSAALHAVAESGDVTEYSRSKHGQKCVMVGRITSPAGKLSLVRTVWIMDNSMEFVRLVTAYPHQP